MHVDNKEFLINAISKEEEQQKKIVSINKDKYKPLKHNQINDNIAKGLLEPKQMDMITGNATTKLDPKAKQEFVLTIEKFEELEKMLSNELYQNCKATQFTGKLLDCFFIKMAETGFNSSLIEQDLKEVGKITGRKDLKELRKNVKIALQILKRLKFSYTPKGKSKNNMNYINIYLFGGTEGIKNGKVYFKFNTDFFNIYASSTSFSNLLYMPIEALQSDEKRNPHKYLLHKKIVSHTRINAGDLKRENRIKIKELYDYCVTLPRYENVIQNGGQVDQRIIQPFERDLSVISEFSWQYEAEEPPKDFKEWLETYIIINWNNRLPGLDEVKNGREKQKKKVEKAKQKAIEKQEADKLKSK